VAAAAQLRARIPDRVLNRHLFSPFPSGGVRNSPGAPAFFFLVLAAGALALGCSRPASDDAPAAAARETAVSPVRDVVLVTIDTLRADATGFSGNRKASTPHLDRLAREGVVFDRARASSVVTLPSHATILTGLYPPDHGVRDNTGFRLDASIPTLATIARERGWATGAFVAAFPLDSRYGLDRGFDVYDDGYAPSGTPGDFAMPERAAPEVVSAALAWWGAQKGRPRLLWVHLYEPHAPYRPAPPFGEKFRDEPYLGEVSAADAALGPLFDALGPARDETLAVVTSDHGESLGEHGEATHGLFAYEATLRVPLVVWAPGTLSPRRDEAAARHVDLLPTILERAGLPVPAGLPGRSLATPAAGEPQSTYFEAMSASLNRGWAPLSGVVEGGWKLVHLPIPELYDLASDTAEATNLFGSRRDVARRLQALLPKPRTAAAKAPSVAGGEEARRLLSLGYLSASGRSAPAWTPENDPKSLVGVNAKIHGAIELYQEGRAGEAAAAARAIVRERPAMSVGYELLSFLLDETGRRGEAVETLAAARKLGLASEAMQVRLALLLSEGGRAADALGVLTPLSGSEDPDTKNAIGIALADAGRLEEALGVFAGILARDPRDPVARQNAGIAFLKGERVNDAVRSLDAALAINERLPLAWNARGVAKAKLGDFREASRSWERAAALDPRQFDALFNLGVTARRRDALERFVRTAPPARYRAEIASARRLLRGLT